MEHLAPQVSNAAWYVIHTKPRQEFRALAQLENQSYTCFLPVLQVEKVFNGKAKTQAEPLFSRYMFIQLDLGRQRLTPVLNTRGVDKLVAFGQKFPTVTDEFIAMLKQGPSSTKRGFVHGDRVIIQRGPFAGMEGIYQIHDGEARAVILMNLMHTPQRLSLATNLLQKAT